MMNDEGKKRQHNFGENLLQRGQLKHEGGDERLIL
jgi:hypothetical protein